MKNKNYISITEVSELLKIKKHVIRYWDSRFEGISTRLTNKKRRFFSQKNITKLQTLKDLLHTNNKAHHSLEMAKKILDNYASKKNKHPVIEPLNNIVKIDKLVEISANLKKIIKSI